MLHDTIEDTDTTYEELVKEFGVSVANIVLEVTDDKSLPKDQRKRNQVMHVPYISDKAKIVKLCDKLYNLRDLTKQPPKGYTIERIQGYCIWARLVLQGIRGLNLAVEKCLDDEIFNSTFVFTDGNTYKCCPEILDECFIFPTN